MPAIENPAERQNALPGYLTSILPDVLAEWRGQSQSLIYRREPEAWIADVLGRRWYSKQREMGQMFVDNERSAVKSANGVGKSDAVAGLIAWWVSVFPLDEALAIISAPTLSQIEKVIFAYLKTNYGYARAGGHPLPGKINDSLEWVYDDEDGQKAFLAFGKRPGDKDIVSAFQGTRKLRTAVFFDEAGGVPPDLWVAAEAVMTGGYSKLFTIGNPDNLGTEFHKIFTTQKLMDEFARLTISVFDLPTFTGERVYQDPEKQERMLMGMTSKSWVENKQRTWGEDSARYQSKVLGEFPSVDDKSFFSQLEIDKAADTVIVEDLDFDARAGLDVARFGEDDSTLYANRNGRIRRMDSWGKTPTNETAMKAHRIMTLHGFPEIVIDGAGVGGGVVDPMLAMAENKYRIIVALGNERAPDVVQYANARAYWYDQFRTACRLGLVDLDLDEDDQLKQEMLNLRYDFTLKGQLKIESKKDMQARGVKSPDRLDAVVYSFMNIAELSPMAAAGINKGDIVLIDPIEAALEELTWLPI